MAMDNQTNQGALTLINDLVDDLLGEETTAAKKANTVVASVGGLITLLGTVAAFLVESETTLPSWFPLVITFLGIAGTIFKTNRTQNGITPSVAMRLQDKLGERIDVAHYHELSQGPAPQYPVDRHAEPQYRDDYPTEQFAPVNPLDSLRNAAESIISNAVNRR